MRTRRSNRTKSYKIEKYDFEDSSADEATLPARDAADDDKNFDEEAAAAESAEDEDDAEEVVASPSEESEVEDLEAPAPRRVRPAKPFRPKSSGKSLYLDVEPMPTDSHLPRGYAGHFDRNVRGPGLVRAWYGPESKSIENSMMILDKWADYSLLPPRELVDKEEPKGAWLPDVFERESAFAEEWLKKLRGSGLGTRWSALSEDEAWPYRMGQHQGTLPVLIGPESNYEMRLEPGQAQAVSQSGLPLDQDDNKAKAHLGWMLDAGGIVMSLDWAPKRDINSQQVLALAVIPHMDQESYNPEKEAWRVEFAQHGTIQLWGFRGDKTKENTVRPSSQPPKLLKTLCLDGGRARRIKWSPACRHLAILCGNGNVYVVDPEDGREGTYELLQQPIAVLSLSEEEDVNGTAMAWVTFNRIAVGYSDGSIALWSIFPTLLLARHMVHHSAVVDIASGYPTFPYILCSTPIGGFAKIIDLQAPSYESSEVPTLSVNVAGNLMNWSDHFLGFFSLVPSSNVLNTMVGFMHHKNFPIVRRVFTGERMVTCLSIGRMHPYLLIGTSDGSLWAMNPQFELIHARRELTDRIRILHHEHRPQLDSARGASRIVLGYKAEKNRHSKSEARAAAANKKKLRRKNEDADDEMQGPSDPTRGILSEPLTRLTGVEWNPNQGFGCWAAVTMASGLVRIIDLAVERID